MVRLPFLFAMALLLAPLAVATDGVLEINQACAVNTGCFPGDDPGFPVTILQPGSYRLTGSLTISSATTTAIQVQAEGVEIDLGGFSILGPNQCAHAQRIPPASPTLSCTYSGATLGRGIDGLSERISVRNGEIRGMGGAGVSLTSLGRAEHLTVTDNGASGIFAPLSILNDLVVARNFGPGISGVYSSVTNSVAAQNQVGIADAQIITRCTIQQNTMGGVIATSVSVSGSTIANNGGDGLSLGWGILTGNNIGGNLGCGAKFATGVGASGAIGDNDFINNNLGVTCTGGGNQKQITGNVIATSCNVVTCTTGGVQVGSFCPTNTLTCL